MSRWFYKDHFFPRDLINEPAWVKASHGFKEYYRFLCWHSWLTKRSPTRRYTSWTERQIAGHIGRSPRQVRRYVKYAKENFLIYRWYAGDSGTTSKNGRPRAPRDEIPASRGMINWWRRVRRILTVKFHHRKEVTVIKTAKKYHYRCPYCLTQSQRNGQDGWQGILGRKNRPPKCEVCGVRTRHIYRK